MYSLHHRVFCTKTVGAPNNGIAFSFLTRSRPHGHLQQHHDLHYQQRRSITNAMLESKYFKLSPVPRGSRRKDLYDALASLQYDPKKLYAKYNVNYVKLDDWYVELASVEEGKKLMASRIHITGKLVRTQPVTADIYMLEVDRSIGYNGGRAILMNGVPPDADSGDVKRFLQGFQVQDVIVVKDEKNRPSGKVIVLLDSELEAHRAVLEKHRKSFRLSPVFINILH